MLHSNFFFISDKNKSREFLYLLGKPRSTWENDTNKRIISEKVQKTGPACKLKMTLWYEEINGARIEFGIQTETQTGDNREFFTYSEFHSILFIDDPKEKIKNDTSHGWTTFSIPVHQYNTPFKLSIDVKRNIQSPNHSFLALDELRLIDCAPRKNILYIILFYVSM